MNGRIYKAEPQLSPSSIICTNPALRQPKPRSPRNRFTSLAMACLSLGAVITPMSASWAQTLTQPSPTPEVDTLASQLISKEKDKQTAAFETLSAIGAGKSEESQAAIRALTQAIASKDPMIRRNAILALRSIGSGAEAAIPTLIKALHDSDKDVRQSAVLALRSIDATPAVADLIQALHDQDDGVRENAARALQSIGYYAKDAIPKLVELLQTDPNSDVQSSAAIALSVLNSDIRSSGTLTPALMDANDEMIVAALNRGLQDPSWLVRKSAAEALITVAQDEAGDAIISARAAVPNLQITLKDKNGTLRSYSALALGAIGAASQEAIPLLTDALKDNNAYVRGNAANALGKILSRLSQFADPEKAAVAALIQTLGDEEPIVRSNALPALKQVADNLEGQIESGAFDLEQAISYVDNALTLLRDPRFKYAPEDIKNVERRFDRLIAQKAGQEIVDGIIKNPWLWGVALYFASLSGLFWLRPLWLLNVDRLLPPLSFNIPFLGVQVSSQSLLFYLQYHPRVLDAWVMVQLKSVREQFHQQQTVQHREIHISVPVTLDGETLPQLTGKDLQAKFRKHLVILGEGGAGKTSLACQIANWAMAENSEEQFGNYPMLPVLIEHELNFAGADGKDPMLLLSEAILGKLQDMIDETEPLSAELLQHLLKQKRILVIVDRLSEMSEKMHEVVHPDNPAFPVNALVVTARNETCLNGFTSRTILQPLRVERDRLSSFMEAYLRQRGKRELFTDPEFFDACGRLSKMVGGRKITVLLARMYADQMIEAKIQSTQDISQQMPDTIPELMLEYLNELNQTDKENWKDDRLVHQDAKIIAWECLKTTYRPRYAKRSAVEAALGEDADNRLKYLENRLRLIQTKGSGKDHISFALDPLAEYLAGLRLIDLYGQDESLWQPFLEQAEAMTEGTETIAGFLSAVRDCCTTDAGQDAQVPSSVVDRLNRMLDAQDPIPDETSKRLEFVVKKVAKAA